MKMIICIFIELDPVIKTTSTASTPKYIETKPRKTIHKDKPKKWKQLRKKENGDHKNEEEHEMTTLLLPELKTQSPLLTSVPSASRSPSWTLLQRNNACGLPVNTTCYVIGFIIFRLYIIITDVF